MSRTIIIIHDILNFETPYFFHLATAAAFSSFGHIITPLPFKHNTSYKFLCL